MTITGCVIQHGAGWGSYLDGLTYPNSVALEGSNTFTDNALGDVRIP